MVCETIYTYKENNNPYAHGENISVEDVSLTCGAERYISFFIGSDDTEGCGIFLTKEETIKLIDSLNMAISKMK
jgi:hypothetical protein